MPSTRRSLGEVQTNNVAPAPVNTPGKAVKSLKAELEKKDEENKELRAKVESLTKALNIMNLAKDKMVAIPVDTTATAEGAENKKKKDKNAPMPAKTAYKFFCEAHPPVEGVDQRAKWKECSPEMRTLFTNMANADKDRFERENAEYETEKAAMEMYYKQQKQNAAMEFYEASQAAMQIVNADDGKKKKKTKKDAEAPKRPMTAFLYFSQEKRESVKAKNPNASMGEISKILGDMWKEVKNTKKYDKLAADAKAVYDTEKAAYDAMMAQRKATMEQEKANKLQQEKEEALKMYKDTMSVAHSVAAPIEDISVLTGDTKNAADKKKKKDPNQPKRSLSAYNYFMKENQAAIKAKMTGEYKQADVVKEVAAQWKALPESKKKKYIKMSETDKKRHDKEMEAYKAKQPVA
mmetsp:Transcript_4472/g.8510  ORF Transcript_4472/g.8510 Transcript_4472/m.8510 type:complete len:407 (+) Transcript_4472:72-1292(+)|eukprot:scaffold1400_cov175-Amphora_coffeaeformis.AAC.12